MCQPIYIKCSTAKAGVAGRHTQGPHLAVQVTISNLSGDTLKSLEFRGDPLQLCSATCKDERPSSGHAKVSNWGVHVLHNTLTTDVLLAPSAATSCAHYW